MLVKIGKYIGFVCTVGPIKCAPPVIVPISRVPKGEESSVRDLFQKADGRVTALVVVQGYSQEAGIDRGKKFAPVCRIGSQRILLAIAGVHD